MLICNEIWFKYQRNIRLSKLHVNSMVRKLHVNSVLPQDQLRLCLGHQKSLLRRDIQQQGVCIWEECCRWKKCMQDVVPNILSSDPAQSHVYIPWSISIYLLTRAIVCPYFFSVLFQSTSHHVHPLQVRHHSSHAFSWRICTNRFVSSAQQGVRKQMNLM